MSKHKRLPSIKYLNECIIYDSFTGDIYWKRRPRKHFDDDHHWKIWNAKHSGKRAFKTMDSAGHMQSRIDGVLYLAHRIIWKMMTGKDPDRLVDHRDRKGGNNEWKNLRLATYPQNGANHKIASNNTSGATGVHFSKKEKKWKAYIRFHGKTILLGTHNSKVEAVYARKQGEQLYHGEFAPQ